MNTLAFTPEESQKLQAHGYKVAGHAATMTGHVGDTSGHNHTIQIHKTPHGVQVKHQQRTRTGLVTHHNAVHPTFEHAMQYVNHKSPTKAAPKLAVAKKEKDWHIETLEKMPMKPAGTLKNGKQYYSMVHHPAHKSFTAEEHAEAAKQLHDKGVEEWQKGHDNDDGYGINHARGLMIASKGHLEAAKSKGLPKHNNPKR